jgi:hypothetical protein
MKDSFFVQKRKKIIESEQEDSEQEEEEEEEEEEKEQEKEEEETPAQKRLRLAKSYLDKVKQDTIEGFVS